ncbi:MAG: glycosyltransferase 87 family protein [archaeon]|nr:glycosyltransferase 87 family protein [archaeon]
MLRDALTRYSHRQLLLFFSIALLVFYGCILLFSDPTPEFLEDVAVFHRKWELLEHGELPYIDFNYPYPPLSLPILALPGFLSESVEGFFVVFSLEILVFTLISIALTMKISDRMGLDSRSVGLLYFVLTMIYFEESVKKFDIIVVVTVLSALYLFFEKRYSACYLFLVVGTLIKVYPVFLIPVLLLFQFTSEDRDVRKSGAWCLAVLTVSAFVICSILASALSPEIFLNQLFDQTERGFQVESTIGVLANLLGTLGLMDTAIEFEAYTHIVVSPLCDLLQDSWNLVLYTSMAISYLVIWKYLSAPCAVDGRCSKLVKCLVFVILGMLLVHRVFSTQYLLWLLPLAAILIYCRGDRKRENIAGIGCITVLVLSLMYIYFGWTFGYSQPLVLTMIVVRNTVLWIMFIVIVSDMLCRDIGGSERSLYHLY